MTLARAAAEETIFSVAELDGSRGDEKGPERVSKGTKIV